MKHTCFAIVLSAACCAPTVAGPTFGVFSPARQGQLSMTTSSQANDFRAAIVAAFPSAVFVPMPTVSAANLAGVDAVILSSATGGTAAITPLTADEQNALRAFVNSGGGAVLFTDNDSFAGGASTPANTSLVGPFGVTPSGTGAPWAQTATVFNTSPLSPVLNGPFGSVQTYSVGWSG